MPSSTSPPGGDIVNDQNRSDLQTIIQFSISSTTPSPPQLSSSNPKLDLHISAKQKWSAHPDRPLTITTVRTPLDVEVPGKTWTGWHIKNGLMINGKNKFLQGGARRRTLPPDDDEWQKKYDFITIPSFSSGQSYTVTREFDFRDVFGDEIPSSATVALDQIFTARPGIEWAQWGDVEGDLKGLRLDNRSDPKFNDKDREEERKKLPKDLVLPFGAWKDDADEEGNEWVWTEGEVDGSQIEVEFR